MSKKAEPKPDLSMFQTTELFEEIRGRVFGAVLLLEHPPYEGKGLEISIFSSVPQSAAVGMMGRAVFKMLIPAG